MYASYTSASPIQIREVESYYDKQSGACVPRRIAVERQKVNLEDFAASYDELFWLKLYYRIRLKEAQINTPDSLLTRELIKLEQIYNSLDYGSALDYINDKVKAQMMWV